MSIPPVWVGAGCGLLFGCGLLLGYAGLPMNRRPTLEDRVAPYVRDALTPSRLLATPTSPNPLRVLERLLRPVMADAIGWIERISGGSASVRRRLDQLGRDTSIDQFRAQQVVWGALGLLAGLGLALAVGLRRGFPVPVLLGLVIAGGIGGVLARDYLLTRAVRARENRILTEFPTVAELLALSVSAGEGAVGALERVARCTRGDLAGELRRTLADARAGANLVAALEGLADRTSLPILARFVDGVAVAVERGTPLAEVLRAQASDVREASRRQLMETGGRKELAMMMPVVFLILPVTVVFAVFPGFAVLSIAGP